MFQPNNLENSNALSNAMAVLRALASIGIFAEDSNEALLRQYY